MKKYFLSLCFLLVSCSSMVKTEPGTEDLVRLEAEPIGCRFLYKMDAEATVFNQTDADQFFRNRMVNQTQRGNAYWIISQRTRPVEGAIFGPKQTFIITANVYDCPDTHSVLLKRDFETGGTGRNKS